MNPRSRMGVTLRPEIHKRLMRLCPIPAPIVERERPQRWPPTPTAKLSPERVKTLRRLRAEGVTLVALARRFHVATSTVWRAVHGETWRT